MRQLILLFLASVFLFVGPVMRADVLKPYKVISKPKSFSNFLMISGSSPRPPL